MTRKRGGREIVGGGRSILQFDQLPMAKMHTRRLEGRLRWWWAGGGGRGDFLPTLRFPPFLNEIKAIEKKPPSPPSSHVGIRKRPVFSFRPFAAPSCTYSLSLLSLPIKERLIYVMNQLSLLFGKTTLPLRRRTTQTLPSVIGQDRCE